MQSFKRCDQLVFVFNKGIFVKKEGSYVDFYISFEIIPRAAIVVGLLLD